MTPADRVLSDWYVVVAALLSALVLGSCTGDGTAPGDSARSRSGVTSASSTSGGETPSSAGDPQPIAGELARRVAEAKALAVRERNADADELVVERAEKVSWPDSAYGCPATEQTYEPGPFAGYRIVLSHGDLSYTYTAAEDTELTECLFLE